MAKGNNQKLKLLYLIKILTEQTDEEHGLTMPELIEKLAGYDVTVDRKTIYTDLEELRHFGIDIVGEKSGKNFVYRVVSRNFELPELKLLVDSVQAAKFITEKKSHVLIKKLESLVSVYEAKQLQRQVLISGRVKTMNESIYYNVDKIHAAINGNVQIRFQYFQWNIEKKQTLRHDGAWYQVSPWHLIWDNEYYYLVAYDAASGILKHYRVDKMLKIAETKQPREGNEQVSQLNIAAYAKSVFGMFGGETVTVTIEAENQFAGILIDRFGKDIPIVRLDEGHFRTNIDVVPSRIFTGWVLSLGKGIRITAPESVTAQIRTELCYLNEIYLKGENE